MLFSAHSLFPSDLFITKLYSFHLQLSCTFFFIRQIQRVHYIVHTNTCKRPAKSAPSPTPKFLVAFAPCLCTTPCWLKANWKICYTGYLFFFTFIDPLQFFFFIKNTNDFRSKLFIFVYHPQYIHILCSGKMVAKND